MILESESDSIFRIKAWFVGIGIGIGITGCWNRNQNRNQEFWETLESESESESFATGNGIEIGILYFGKPWNLQILPGFFLNEQLVIGTCPGC